MSTGTGIVVAAVVWCATILGLAFFFPNVDAPTVMLTFGILVVAYLTFRTYRRFEWFTGAMERHSDQQRQLAAKAQQVQLIWWDKTQADGEFPFTGRHNEPFELSEIYVGIPTEYRQKQTPMWRKLLVGDP